MHLFDTFYHLHLRLLTLNCNTHDAETGDNMAPQIFFGVAGGHLHPQLYDPLQQYGVAGVGCILSPGTGNS